MFNKIKSVISIFVATPILLMATPALATTVIPTILSVSPTSGDIDGGNIVTIVGRDFVESTGVRVDGIIVADTLVSDSQITIVMPSRSIGRVSISVFEGMVGAVLPNAYEYIDIPDPEPTPEPEPTTEPTAPSTPPVVVDTPTTYVIETPQPTIVVQSSPVQAVQQSAVVEEPTQQTLIEIYPSYFFSNNVQVHSNKETMNVVIDPIFTKRFRFTLQKMVNGSWSTVKVAYRNTSGRLVFYGVPFEEGRYRVINSAQPLRWFTIVF